MDGRRGIGEQRRWDLRCGSQRRRRGAPPARLDHRQEPNRVQPRGQGFSGDLRLGFR